MGRYYYGDIEGKFWFAVQSSYAADRFGVGASCENMYHFNGDNLDSLEKEISNIEAFIDSNEYYKKIVECFKFNENPELNISQKDYMYNTLKWDTKKVDRYNKSFSAGMYNDDMLAKYAKPMEHHISSFNKSNDRIIRKVLSEYADLLLGVQIRDCINKIGKCDFEAEI